MKGQEMREYQFKPAPLRDVMHFHLDDDNLRQLTRDGQAEWQLPLQDVQAVRYVHHRINGLSFWRLDIKARDGGLFRVSENQGAEGISDPQAQNLLQDLCLTLSKHHPDLQITIGEYGRARLAIFAIGIMSLIFALGLVAVALWTGLAPNRFVAASVPVLLLLLFGGVVSYSNRPGQPLPRLSIVELPGLHTAQKP